MNQRFLACALALGVAGCAAAGPDTDLETGGDALTATSAQLRVTVRDVAQFDARGALILRGTTDRDVQNVQSWVPDDAFGEARLLGARRFEIALRDGHEINTIVSGSPLFLTFETRTGRVHAMLHLAPRFARFRGPRTVTIDEVIRPVYVRDAENPLRYRGRVSSSRGLADVEVYSASNPEESRVDGQTFAFDWAYEGFEVSADPSVTDAVEFRATFADGRSATKRAQIEIRSVRLELAAGDVPLAWELAQCDESVYWCIQSASADQDLAGCGDYRDVSLCLNASPDEVCSFEGSSPFSLVEFDASDELAPSIANYNASGWAGGRFYSLGGVQAFSVPACLDAPPSLAQAIEYLQNSQDFVAGGEILDRAGIEASPLFSAPGGPALLLALDVTSGGGDIEAYVARTEFACQNCTQFAEYTVLFYPSSNTFFVVQGTSGYDS